MLGLPDFKLSAVNSHSHTATACSRVIAVQGTLTALIMLAFCCEGEGSGRDNYAAAQQLQNLRFGHWQRQFTWLLWNRRIHPEIDHQ